MGESTDVHFMEDLLNEMDTRTWCESKNERGCVRVDESTDVHFMQELLYEIDTRT